MEEDDAQNETLTKINFFVHLFCSSGPVEIVRVGAEVARADGPSALLQFAAVISVNLAVINSLPVPGLDGGQMVFVLAEIVSGKKLDRQVCRIFFPFSK